MSYSNINRSTDFFNTKLYQGNGSTQSITGVGFQPDWVWVKSRSNTTNHSAYDIIRGVQQELRPNSTDAEATRSTGLTSFDSDGFSAGNNININNSGYTYASWNWKANGAGSTNYDGSITSTVSANTTAGFSIVSFNQTSSPQTIGHGLNSVPKIIFIKDRDSVSDWQVYSESIGASNKLLLNSTNASASSGIFNSTAPTSSVFTFNANYGSTIAYCFAEKPGYSKFGSYGGNQNADGNFIYLGFKPAFVMIKRYSAGNPTATNWQILDNKRNTFNPQNNHLRPNSSGAEFTNYPIDFLSNGFKLRTTDADINNNGHNYIYMAFGQSLVGSNNVPCTAR
jgi:hypothetical protein